MDLENVTEITQVKTRCAEIVTRLIENRKQSGTSQEDCADQLGVSRKKLSEFENGSFDFDLFLKYCYFMGIDIKLNYTQ